MIYNFKCEVCGAEEEKEIAIADYDKEKENQKCTCGCKMKRVIEWSGHCSRKRARVVWQE